MLLTALFCFIAAYMLGVPMWGFIVGFLCAFLSPWIALFGLFMCIAMDASIGFWIIGFLCLMIDSYT